MACEIKRPPTDETGEQLPLILRVEHLDAGPELVATCRRAISAGFAGIELSCDTTPDHAAGQEYVVRLPGPRDLAGEELTICAVAAPCLARGIEDAQKEVAGLLHRAGDLGARCLNLTTPPVGGKFGHAGFSRYQDALNFAYELMHHLRYEAEAAGVALALEVPAENSLLSPVELREIIDAANSWAVGVCINAGSVARISSVQDWVATLGHRVHALRLPEGGSGLGWDSDQGDEQIDLDAIARALDGIGPDRLVIGCGSGRPDEIYKRISQAWLSR